MNIVTAPLIICLTPFASGTTPVSVDGSGSLCDAQVLDVTDNVVAEKCVAALETPSQPSWSLDMPVDSSVAHGIATACEARLSATVALEKDTCDEADLYQACLADPSPSACAGSGGGGKGEGAATVVEGVAAAEEAPPVVDMCGGGDDGGDYSARYVCQFI